MPRDIDSDLRASHQALLAVMPKIEKAWRRFDNNCAYFADIVYEHTRDLDLSPFGELSNLTRLLQDPSVASIQQASLFADFFFKLCDNGLFWIEVLNWWGSDINIHDHDFSGMQFQLKGDSLN